MGCGSGDSIDQGDMSGFRPAAAAAESLEDTKWPITAVTDVAARPATQSHDQPGDCAGKPP